MSATINAINAVVKRFHEEVEMGSTLDLRGRVSYDNAPFAQPDTEWVRWTIITGDSVRTEIGTTTTLRTIGVGIASIFVPREIGMRRALEVADVVRDAFDPRETVEGVSYDSPSMENLGRDGEFWSVNVRCPFSIDEVN